MLQVTYPENNVSWESQKLEDKILSHGEKQEDKQNGFHEREGNSTDKRKTLKTHTIALRLILAYTFMVSGYQFPGCLDGGATSDVATKIPISLFPCLPRVGTSGLFLCLAFSVRNK